MLFAVEITEKCPRLTYAEWEKLISWMESRGVQLVRFHGGQVGRPEDLLPNRASIEPDQKLFIYIGATIYFPLDEDAVYFRLKYC